MRNNGHRHVELVKTKVTTTHHNLITNKEVMVMMLKGKLKNSKIYSSDSSFHTVLEKVLLTTTCFKDYYN